MDILTIEQLTNLAVTGLNIAKKESNNSYDVSKKEDGSLITQADIRANSVIIEKAKNMCPDICIHSEEKILHDWYEIENVLIIDPLDGTTNFVHKIPLFSVSIALVQYGIPIKAVIAPILGGLYWSEKGKGSYFANSHNNINDSIKLKCARRSLNESMLHITADQNNSKSRKIWWSWLSKSRPPLCYRIHIIESAALELCWLASGKIDAYMHPTDKEWDIAAGGLIAKEAGVKVLGVDFNEWDLRKNGIIAITPIIASDIKKILRE